MTYVLLMTTMWFGFLIVCGVVEMFTGGDA